MNPILNIAIRIIRVSSNLVLDYYEKGYREKHKIIKKVMLLINRMIYNFYPKHIVISDSDLTKELLDLNQVIWVINVIDGLVNFYRKIPNFSISIAVIFKNTIEISIIYDPIKNELFYASKGDGAQLNGYRLRINSSVSSNIKILSIYSFENFYKNYINLFHKLSLYCFEYRYTGSVLLDLAYIASNRIDGFFAIKILPKFILSGILLVIESGGFVIDFFENCDYFSFRSLIIGNLQTVKILQNFCKKNL